MSTFSFPYGDLHLAACVLRANIGKRGSGFNIQYVNFVYCPAPAMCEVSTSRYPDSKPPFLCLAVACLEGAGDVGQRKNYLDRLSTKPSVLNFIFIPTSG